MAAAGLVSTAIATVGTTTAGAQVDRPAPPAVAASQSAPQPDLGPNQRLTAGHELAMGPYSLQMKQDGNLVAEEGGYVFWQTATGGHPGAHTVLQGDGNLVVYGPDGSALWATGAAGPGTCLLGSATNGRMVVDTPGDVVGWWPLWSLAPCYAGSGTRVAVVGDSITLLATNAFPQELAPYYAYDVSGMAGYEFGGQVPAERAMIDNPLGKARDVIINLGTNDADHDNAGWQPGFDQILEGAGDRCTILVTVSDRADADSGVPGDHIASAVNNAERGWARTHHNFHVLPWAELLRENGYQWVGQDGIHPNGAGTVVLAQLYRQYLRQDCGP